MIIKNNKKVIGIYKGNTPITKIYKGNKVVWKKDDVVHIIGSFVEGTPESERYVWINGTKYTLDEQFDFTLKDVVWKYGETDDGTTPWFGNGLKSLTYVEGMNNIENARAMFSGCSQLTDISGLKYWNTNKLRRTRNMFINCSSLTDKTPIKNWDVSNVWYMYGMFNAAGGEEIDLSNWKPNNISDCTNMFSKCKASRIDLSNWKITNNATALTSMFGQCENLKEVSFANCDFDSVNTSTNMFHTCRALTTIIGPVKNWSRTDVRFQYCPLSNESAMVIINGIKEGTSKTLTFRDVTYDTLTPEQISIATAKGWSIAKENL